MVEPLEERGGGRSDWEERTWFEYRRLILSELKRISDDISEVNAKIDRLRSDEIGKLKVDVAMLQVKAGMWGALGGLGTALGAYLLTRIGSGG